MWKRISVMLITANKNYRILLDKISELPTTIKFI